MRDLLARKRSIRDLLIFPKTLTLPRWQRFEVGKGRIWPSNRAGHENATSCADPFARSLPVMARTIASARTLTSCRRGRFAFGRGLTRGFACGFFGFGEWCGMQRRLSSKAEPEEKQSISDEERALRSQAASILGKLGGSKGGKMRASKLSAERRREIASMAAASRWKRRESA